MVSCFAIPCSDAIVIAAIMLEIVRQIGKCAARKTHRKRARDIAVVRPGVGNSVRPCTIGVREVNFWTHCRVIKRLVIAVFHSELASFRNGMTGSPEVAARAALARRVRAAADSGIGCYCARVVIIDVRKV